MPGWYELRPVAIPATSVFVGRETELRVLDDAFAAASAGHSRLLLVEGEAGIGKTTLVERFVSELQTARVLRASGDESESHVPFAMADQLLRTTAAPATRCVRGATSPSAWSCWS